MKPRDANDILREDGEDALRAQFDNAARQPRQPRAAARRELTVAAWLNRRLPERDYLIEDLLCTTARWLISGDTGIGKTLFSLELGFAIAAGANFLIWKGGRRSRVMYLDGEMPAETMKERIVAAATIYGDVDLFAYNRDLLGSNAMPPLNRPEGQKWLWREIEAVKPDLIVFDSLMCLLVGPLSEEETWQPISPLIRQLSARRIAQLWLNHTGHDASRSFGTKTKEWEMDTVAMLSRKEGDEEAILLEFKKARLRTPRTAGLFKPQLIQRREHGWTSQPANVTPKEGIIERKRIWLVDAYNTLAGDVPLTQDHNGRPVRKVPIAAIRETMVKRGHLEKEDGKLPPRERTNFQRAREGLIVSNQFAADEAHVWSIK
jgi:hypothetical protein